MFTMMPLAFQYACSLRVTDPTVSLAAIEAGLARHVAAGTLQDATLRFDHVGLTFEAASRDEAVAKATALLHDLGARQVQVFGVLLLTPPSGTPGVDR